MTTPIASVIIITFIVAVSVASLAYCIAAGEGRPEVDCDAHNIVIVGQYYCYTGNTITQFCIF